MHSESAALRLVAPELLEAEVRAACRTWDDDLVERLVVEHGDVRGSELAAYYAQRFPEYYKTATHPDLATLHVRLLERVRAGEAVRGRPAERAARTRRTRARSP